MASRQIKKLGKLILFLMLICIHLVVIVLITKNVFSNVVASELNSNSAMNFWILNDAWYDSMRTITFFGVMICIISSVVIIAFIDMGLETLGGIFIEEEHEIQNVVDKIEGTDNEKFNKD
ncbi:MULTISPECIES: hypothetical protein [unclassified Breznakia]|uniref:hypothetical protein n=1 Tax=unclassified Breznakia TaxID=2623764 RepID=UPI002476EDC8|nr:MULTISPECIES: hypothetical protein [unclassified Breznakia]